MLIEDAVDVLTLKDNGSSVEDYATALYLLARVQVSDPTYDHVHELNPSQNLPKPREASAFRTIWRRIYIHDE